MGKGKEERKDVRIGEEGNEGLEDVRMRKRERRGNGKRIEIRGRERGMGEN